MSTEKRSEEWQAMQANVISDVINVANRCDKITIFRELSRQEQVECVISGLLVGLFITALSQADNPAGREYLATYIKSCLPTAERLANAYITEVRK